MYLKTSVVPTIMLAVKCRAFLRESFLGGRRKREPLFEFFFWVWLILETYFQALLRPFVAFAIAATKLCVFSDAGRIATGMVIHYPRSFPA